jgi:hypothetical protein
VPIITTAEFKAMINKPGNKILTIKASIVPEMRKTDNPYFGRVVKLVEVNGSCGANYQDSVNRILVKYGYPATFVSGERQWGEKIDNTFTVNKDGTKEYINLQEQSRKEQWLLDGQPVGKSMFDKWTKSDKASPPLKMEDDPTKWAQAQVKYRNFTMTNIVQVKYNGETWYLVENFKPANERVG